MCIRDRHPDARRQLGLAFVPAERLGHGAVPEMSLVDNALLTAFGQDLVKGGLVQRSKVRALAEQIIQRFAVKTPDADTAARSLSGGNLQKFILGQMCIRDRPYILRLPPMPPSEVPAMLTPW